MGIVGGTGMDRVAVGNGRQHAIPNKRGGPVNKKGEPHDNHMFTLIRNGGSSFPNLTGRVSETSRTEAE